MNAFYFAMAVAGEVSAAAIGYFWGRESRDQELKKFWFEKRCRECGAQPVPRLIHVSGCESGWPESSKLASPGES
jgi:hypothetical protein